MKTFVVNLKSTSNFIWVPSLFPELLFPKVFDPPKVFVLELLPKRPEELVCVLLPKRFPPLFEPKVFVVELPNVEVEFPKDQFLKFLYLRLNENYLRKARRQLRYYLSFQRDRRSWNFGYFPRKKNCSDCCCSQTCCLKSLFSKTDFEKSFVYKKCSSFRLILERIKNLIIFFGSGRLETFWLCWKFVDRQLRNIQILTIKITCSTGITSISKKGIRLWICVSVSEEASSARICVSKSRVAKTGWPKSRFVITPEHDGQPILYQFL